MRGVTENLESECRESFSGQTLLQIRELDQSIKAIVWCVWSGGPVSGQVRVIITNNTNDVPLHLLQTDPH